MLTSPAIATLGMSITVPLALITDFVLHGQSPTVASGFGGLLVMIGFGVVNISDEWNDKLSSLLCCGRGGGGSEDSSDGLTTPSMHVSLTHNSESN